MPPHCEDISTTGQTNTALKRNSRFQRRFPHFQLRSALLPHCRLKKGACSHTPLLQFCLCSGNNACSVWKHLSYLTHTHCTLHPVRVCEKEGGREGDGDHQPTAVSHPHPSFAENTHAGTQAAEAHAGLTAPRETSSRPEFLSQMQKSELTAPPPHTQQTQTRIARSNTACISNGESCKAVILHACLLGHQVPPLLIALGMDAGLRVRASFCIALTHLPAIMLIWCAFGASAPEKPSDKRTVINRAVAPG